jgi:hypothetical protein
MYQVNITILLTHLIYPIETPINSNRTISDVLNDPELIPKGTTEKLFVLRKRTNVSLPPSPVVQPVTSISDSTAVGTESPNNQHHNNGNRFMRFLKQDNNKEAHTLARPASAERINSNESSTGSVLRRLDQAIQSLENDKRHLDKTSQATTTRTMPMRSNSLSAVSSYRPNYNNTNMLSHNLPRTKNAPTQQYTRMLSTVE